MSDLQFQCSSCGACCRRVWKMPQLRHWATEDGSCKHLQANNECGIYETRPDICSVKKTYKARNIEDQLSETEYYVLSNMVCNDLIEEDGLDESLKIDITNY